MGTEQGVSGEWVGSEWGVSREWVGSRRGVSGEWVGKMGMYRAQVCMHSHTFTPCIHCSSRSNMVDMSGSWMLVLMAWLSSLASSLKYSLEVEERLEATCSCAAISSFTKQSSW